MIIALISNGSEKNIINKKEIPIVRSDRGGQVTYHGPGQLVVYFLLNIKRLGWGPKKLIFYLEEIFIRLISQYNIKAKRKEGAPGIYVADKKIASIGLKIKQGFSYHGVSLNVDMNLSPFDDINICGYKALEATQINDLASASIEQIKEDLKSLLEDRSFKTA